MFNKPCGAYILVDTEPATGPEIVAQAQASLLGLDSPPRASERASWMRRRRRSEICGSVEEEEAEGGRGGSSIGGRLAPARAQAGYPTLLPPPQHLRGACSRGGLRLLPTAPAPHSAQCGAHGARHGRRRRRQADR